MYEELFKAAGDAGAKGKAWEDQLPQDERDLLPGFQEFLERTEGKSEATSRAYRSYVAQAMCKLRGGDSWKDLTTDVRSAVNAFIRFSAALAELAGDLPVEEEIEA
jgi:hypothetical protein